MTAPLRVTAWLDTPCIGLDRHPTMLDGPLAWAWAETARGKGITLPPITHTHAPDMPLPLATWGDPAGVWGWRSSAAHLDIARLTGVEVRRRPAIEAMTRHATDRKHHLGLGPHKARDVRIQAAWIRSAWWDVDCTDTSELERLLASITHLGARHRNGFGHVHRWTVTAGLPQGWRDRPMPDTHPGTPTRAPYWHWTRKT